MASVYTLAKEFIDAVENINELIEDGLEISENAYTDTLEMLQMPIEQKAENIIKYAKNIEALVAARKSEAKRLNELASKDSKKAERLLSYLDDALKMMGKTQLTAGVFEIKYKKGSEIVVVDESKLPDEYFTSEIVKKAMDKPQLKKLIKDGLEIPGVNIVRNENKLVIK